MQKLEKHYYIKPDGKKSDTVEIVTLIDAINENTGLIYYYVTTIKAHISYICCSVSYLLVIGQLDQVLGGVDDNWVVERYTKLNANKGQHSSQDLQAT